MPGKREFQALANRVWGACRSSKDGYARIRIAGDDLTVMGAGLGVNGVIEWIERHGPQGWELVKVDSIGGGEWASGALITLRGNPKTVGPTPQYGLDPGAIRAGLIAVVVLWVVVGPGLFIGSKIQGDHEGPRPIAIIGGIVTSVIVASLLLRWRLHEPAPANNSSPSRAQQAQRATAFVRTGMVARDRQGQALGRVVRHRGEVLDLDGTALHSGVSLGSVPLAEIDVAATVSPYRLTTYPQPGDPVYLRSGGFAGIVVSAKSTLISLDGSVLGVKGEPLTEIFKSDLDMQPASRNPSQDHAVEFSQTAPWHVARPAPVESAKTLDELPPPGPAVSGPTPPPRASGFAPPTQPPVPFVPLQATTTVATRPAESGPERRRPSTVDVAFTGSELYAIVEALMLMRRSSPQRWHELPFLGHNLTMITATAGAHPPDATVKQLCTADELYAWIECLGLPDDGQVQSRQAWRSAAQLRLVDALRRLH